MDLLTKYFKQETFTYNYMTDMQIQSLEQVVLTANNRYLSKQQTIELLNTISRMSLKMQKSFTQTCMPHAPFEQYFRNEVESKYQEIKDDVSDSRMKSMKTTKRTCSTLTDDEH